LLGLLDVYDSNILNGSYNSFNPSHKLSNCEKALGLAEKHVKLPAGILDSVALSESSVSESNLVLYLSLFYNSFKDKFASNTKESLEKRLKDLEEKVRFYEDENETLRILQASLKQQEMTLSSTFKETSEQKLKLSHVKEEIETELINLNQSHHKEKNSLLTKIHELNEEIKVLKSTADSSTTKLQNEKDNLTKERDHIKEELKGTKDKLIKEIEEITAKNEEISSNLKKVNRMREELEEISKQQDDNNQTSLTILRKHLIRHIKDMQVWKVYLESDRKYKPDQPLNIISEGDCEKLPYRRQLFELNALVLGENKLLEKLIGEREIEAAEVVAVNIGKKKKRIKKNDPLIEGIPLMEGSVGIANVDNKAKKEEKKQEEKKTPKCRPYSERG